MFPLSASPVAVVGSRHGSPFGVAQFAAAVIQAGGSVLTGCAAGVDRAAAAAASAAAGVQPARFLPPAYLAHPGPLPRVTVFRSASFQAHHLATRTRYVIQFSAAVAVFPPAGPLGPGSALALRLALAQHGPVFFAGPAAPGATGWQAATVAGVAGWLHVGTAQAGLFG